MPSEALSASPWRIDMKERALTCIVCPKGCPLTVFFDDEGRITSVTGMTCKRGEKYAVDECTHPMRTVTTTVRLSDGSVAAVKTDRTIPKELIFDAMKQINSVVAPCDVCIGDVVIDGVVGTDAKVVVTGKRSI